MSVLRSICRPARLLISGGVMVLIAALALWEIRGAGFDHSDRVSDQQSHAVPIPGGALVIAGGGYVTPETRARFVELAGGPQARLIVIPATDPSLKDEEKWLAPWRSSGAQSVELLHARDRNMANDPQFCAHLKNATGVWFSGGYQDFLADRYVDTAVQDGLHDVLRRNGVVGGCSAGAAILSRVMIEEGENVPIEARGLDLISNAIVDQHFLQRNRLWRMQQMVEKHPDLVGLGVDERTALVVEVQTWRMSVVGDSYAMVCVPGSEPHEPRFEVLKAGDDVLLSQLRKDHLAYHPAVEAQPVISGESLSHAD
jgi:cyanophycinase